MGYLSPIPLLIQLLLVVMPFPSCSQPPTSSPSESSLSLLPLHLIMPPHPHVSGLAYIPSHSPPLLLLICGDLAPSLGGRKFFSPDPRFLNYVFLGKTTRFLRFSPAFPRFFQG